MLTPYRRSPLPCGPWLACLSLAVAFTALSACTTTGGNSDADAEPLPPAPAITSTIPLNDALQAAVDYGGETMGDVKKLLKRRREAATAGPVMQAAVLDNLEKYKNNQLINAVQLYTVLPATQPEIVFEKLVSSGRPLARQLGWQLASLRPSKLIAAAMERELTRALQDSEEEANLLPQMALALQANHLTGAYTYARQGLMLKGHVAFADAIIALDPLRASDDLMTYIAQAPAEELRQLTLASLDVYTCMAALQHLQRHPVSLAHSGAATLFYFAVSRNSALAELAQSVIENYLPQNTDTLAVMLSRLPVWTQIAYLESARRSTTPKVGLLVAELKKVSAQEDVLDELNEVR